MTSFWEALLSITRHGAHPSISMNCTKSWERKKTPQPNKHANKKNPQAHNKHKPAKYRFSEGCSSCSVFLTTLTALTQSSVLCFSYQWDETPENSSSTSDRFSQDPALSIYEVATHQQVTLYTNTHVQNWPFTKYTEPLYTEPLTKALWLMQK